MNGLQLSRDYFFSIAEPALKRDYPDIFPRLAAGLAGNGSECFGYDDELSRDHDWGIDFYIWLLNEDIKEITALENWKRALFKAHPPIFERARSEYGAHINVMTCANFYEQLIGSPNGPSTIPEWLRIPEENLAMAVNGDVFIDGPQAFSKTRSYLLDYYPEDIRKKRIAAKCMAIAQTGQYNHARTAKRHDWVTLRSILSRFSDSIIAIAFLLNRTYKPYYKLAFRSMSSLPILGADLSQLLMTLSEIGGFDDESLHKQKTTISQICKLVVDELRAQSLCSSDDWFLATHGEEVRSSIKDDFLRNLPTQYDI